MIDFIVDEETMQNFINRLMKFNFEHGKLKISSDIVGDAISDSQRCLYWVWMESIRKFIRESTSYSPTAEEMHEYFKKEYLEFEEKVILGKTIMIQPSIARLKIKVMAKYMEQIDLHCVVEYEFYVPTPDDMKFNAERGLYCG